MPIDPNRAEQSRLLIGARVRIIRGALVVRAQYILDVFNGDFAFWVPAPWNIVRGRRVLRTVGIQDALHGPGARSVVNVVGIRV